MKKTCFIMGSGELWEKFFLLCLIFDVWKVQKIKLYSNDSCPSELQSHHSAENVATKQGKLPCNLICTHVNKGRMLLLGLALEDNNCMQAKGTM